MGNIEALEYLKNLTKFGSKLGLERMEAILERFGNPQKGLRVIHVAGTNGKGSVSATTSSILQEAGYRVGLYTSPHLSSFTERISINGKSIVWDDVTQIIEELIPVIKDLASVPELGHPTEFEAITALALIYFSRNSLDYVLLEVGLGGRLDATNVVMPHLAAITHVDFDHMDRLGHTLDKIAFEKAGIIKPGVITVVGPQEPEAMETIISMAQERSAPVIRVGEKDSCECDLIYSDVEPQLYGTVFSAAFPESGWKYKRLHTSLLGEHQGENSAIALGIVEGLRRQGAFISEKAVRLGLLRTLWPGRMEVVRERPMVVLDGAHNLGGARMLRRNLQAIASKRPMAGRTILVTGMLSDKEVDKMLEALVPLANKVVATTPENPRALPAADLAKKASEYCSHVEVEPIPVKAVELGLDSSLPEDLICICGSLYLIGAIRPHIVCKARAVIFAGDFGSENAINYSITMAKRGHRVKLVDLNIVNSYFRSQKLREELAVEGVEVIYSNLEYNKADLYLKISEALNTPETIIVFDMGIDEQEATILGRFQKTLDEIGYDMYLIAYPFRPYANNEKSILDMCQRISQSSGLSLSGLIYDTNFRSATKVADIIKGYEIIKMVSDSIKLPIRFISINEDFIIDMAEVDSKLCFEEEIFPLKLFMKLPWSRMDAEI